MSIAEYLRRTWEELRGPGWLGAAFLFFIFLGGTNAALALSHPPVGDGARAAFAAAAIVRIVALVWISVALLRRAVGSPRRRWMPDGAFFLYFLLNLLVFAAPVLAGLLSAGLPLAAQLALMQLATVLIVVPFAPWLVAAAVERPIALSPSRWMRDFRDWLGPLALLSLLTVFPLAWVHEWLSGWLVAMPGHAGFIELALADGLVTVLLVLWSLALQLTAYRRVAQG
jgi:hypothetical protein